MLKGLKLF